DVFEKTRALLLEAGATYFGEDNREGGEFWARPGVANHHGLRLRPDGSVFFWTSNFPPFRAGESYDGFQFRAWLLHAGDFTAAAKAVAYEGYGAQRKGDSRKPEPKTQPKAEPTPEPAGDRADTDKWADPQPIPDGLLPVPQLPVALIPAAFRGWLHDIAER